MSSRGLLDGVWVDAAAPQLSPLSDGFQFGLGVFTTLRVRGGAPCWLGAHHARLVRDCAALGLSAPGPLERFVHRCAEVARELSLAESGLKVVLFAEGREVRELILPRPHGYTTDTVAAGRSLKVISCASRSGVRLRAVKSLNYAEHLLAFREARAEGYDDALWVDNDGAALETTTANLFVVRGGEVLTPPLSAGVLAGVARALLLSGAGGRTIREMPIPFAWLRDADEVFVTNALGGVMPVRRLEAFDYRVSKTSVTWRIRESLEGAPECP